jgi:nitroimidazol reductase NimA-like FMN-containing flavoprotein (pyridoxamine 5'-phosphate oxidase superfamily)
MVDPSEEIRNRITSLFETQRLAVLATEGPHGPHASLVAFWGAPDLRRIVFATPRTTRKFANLKDRPRVAVLIDSSRNVPADFHNAMAVTATGSARVLEKDERSITADPFLHRHPYLRDFLRSPTTELLEVAVERYALVRNFQTVMELNLSE